MSKPTVNIIGAGPANLVAAINLSRAGIETIVHEQKGDVGTRFNGDFQGIENWSSDTDVISFLNSIGVQEDFMCEPYYEGDFYDPRLRKVSIKSSKPVFYLVERGKSKHSFDQGLKRQALKAGVKFRWNNKLKSVPAGKVIIGTGPKATDAIARGIVFSTTFQDACIGFLNDEIAPKAYAYLLVHNGKATFATCMFEDFRNQRYYFEKALQTLQKVVKIDINQPKDFGGYVNFFLKPSASKDGRIMYVGENAGFQDALWGFGMKSAMFSGYLAAQSIMTGESYDKLLDKRLRPMMKTSLSNRWIFAHLGNYGYEKFIDRLSKVDDVTVELKKQYNPSRFKQMIFPLAQWWYQTRLKNELCMHPHCDCVWCRHGKNKQHEQEPI